MTQTFTRQQFYDLVWAKPMTHLAKEFAMSDVALHKICKKHAIPNPPLGWWASKAAGQKVRQMPLPKAAPGAATSITIEGGELSREGPKLAAAREHARVVVSNATKSDTDASHPLVERTLARLRKAKPSEQGIIAIEGAGVIKCSVAPFTRALSDFAKIVEVLDARGASFVSVTQSFNTTTSMGRLTMNVLLSFAQFEREVTGERIRDKIAASKKKGMWMGGPVPLGYDVRDRKLVVKEAEAATVRHVFERYRAIGNARELLIELDEAGVRTKATVTKSGLGRGSIAFARGSLLHLLGNRVYIGETKHRDAHYPGEHEAIVPRPLWDEVEAIRSGNSVVRGAARNIAHPSLLIGLVFDGVGRPMSPSHACKGSRRYRYCVTKPDLVTKDEPSWRLPAHDLETLVIRRTAALLAEAHAMQELLASAVALEAPDLSLALDRAKQFAATTDGENPACLKLIERIDLRQDSVDMILDLAALIDCSEHAGSSVTGILHVISTPVARIRRGTEVRLVLANPGTRDDGQVDPALVGLIVRAHAARKVIAKHPGQPLAEIAAAQGVSLKYFALLIRISTLAPDIVAAIIGGRQPAGLNRQRLARFTNLPSDWAEQRAALGFA